MTDYDQQTRIVIPAEPDVLAPGADILAAWAPNRGIACIRDDYLLTDFAIASGSSMASPHVVGVTALLNKVHKDWSPATIRSAIMTTTYVIDNANGPIIDATTNCWTPLDFGAGYINPEKAMDPGLVYDIEVQDYINYLCGMNYTNKQIKVITKRSKFSCDQASLDLNYPCFIVLLNKTNTKSYTFNRVLTNVVDSPSIYRAVVKAPSGMKVVVQPPEVSFAKKYSKAEFKIMVEVTIRDSSSQSDFIVNYGYLSWNDVNGTHMVRSPIVAAHAPYLQHYTEVLQETSNQFSDRVSSACWQAFQTATGELQSLLLLLNLSHPVGLFSLENVPRGNIF
ncbi:subtilisin-like protease SBT3 [Cornus florida]|uniref:subtilisin-like protease SBT3 n=1 Tax=Cornus florida TaxID=4283 RepID=UPI0028A03152|nr:subtilisin-like protease SBT3 [Cornus florida]